MSSLFGKSLGVITVGPSLFADGIRAAGGTAVAVDCAPPGDGDASVATDLSRLVNHPATEAANRTAFERYLASRPVLDGIAPARDGVPGMDEQRILHAGPPVAWDEMCGPMRGAATLRCGSTLPGSPVIARAGSMRSRAASSSSVST